jgi:DUF2911 family protein
MPGTMPLRLALGALGMLTAPSLAPLRLSAQSGTFIVRRGSDTVFVERYARMGSALEGDQVSRSARATTLRHFAAELDRRGNVIRYELTGRPAARPEAPAEVLRVTFDIDTANIELVLGDSSRAARLPIPGGALPFLPQSYALLELVTRQAQASGRPTYVAPVLSLASLVPMAVTVTRGAGDTVAVAVGDAAPLEVRVDAAGDILGARGGDASAPVSVDRVAAVDLAGIARRFAERPLGPLSPTDSVRATIAGAQITIVYSRPAMRGRQIFGGLVPWNAVWRTGANAATQFTTSADLVMAGHTIPHGSYTLWTLPTPTGWQLIVNKQTKRPCREAGCAVATQPPLWGTEYSADSDLVRLDLALERLPRPVEQFTIAVAPQGTGGLLTLEWETTRASLPFARK